MAGGPIVVLAAAVGQALLRRRWKALAGVIGLTIAISAILGIGWVAFDIQTMPAIERYARDEWPLVLVPGAGATGTLLLLGWFLALAVRGIRKLGRHRTPRTMDAVPALPTM